MLELEMSSKAIMSIKLIPIDLGISRDSPVERDLPIIPSKNSAVEILNRLNKISQPFDTSFLFDEEGTAFTISEPENLKKI